MPRADMSSDAIAALVTVAVVAGLFVLALLLVRAARAARRRQLEIADALPSRRGARDKARSPGKISDDDEAAADADTDADAQAADNRKDDDQLGAKAHAPEPPAAAPARRPSQPRLPLPSPPPRPTRPAGAVAPVEPVARPQDRPSGAPAPRKRKDAAALSPGLAKTRSGWVARLRDAFSGKKEIDPALEQEIEKILLTADIGVRAAQTLLGDIRGSLSRQDLSDPAAVWAALRTLAARRLTVDAPPIDLDAGRPFVLLVIGVNGSGKTTTIGKLAAQWRAEGKSVLLAAGDTFRAAAVEQLAIWGERVGAGVVRGKEGADPSSVLFDAVKRARAENIDVVIADTAGRLHTKSDLMEELQKVRRVIGKACEGAPHETWLVIDSTSGQNAIAQAQMFTKAMAVSGIVLTKLDGTAKGGVILGIVDELRIPVRYVGVGERVEDLRSFDAEEFAEALFE